jgi:hypothetical protein
MSGKKALAEASEKAPYLRNPPLRRPKRTAKEIATERSTEKTAGPFIEKESERAEAKRKDVRLMCVGGGGGEKRW